LGPLEVPKKPRLDYKWVTLIVINLGTFMAPLDTGIVALVLPNIARDFSAGIDISIWVPVIYLMILTAFMTSFGRFSDIKGRKRYFNIGLAVFVLGSLLSGISTSLPELLFFRVIQAVGATLLLVNSRSLIVDAFPPGQRGLAMGVHVTVIYLAIATGPALGAVITQLVGWRTVFFINVPIGLAILPISLFKIRESKKFVKQSMDWIGSLVFAAALSALLVAVTFGPKENWTSVNTYVEFIYLPIIDTFIWTRTFISIPLIPLLLASFGLLALFFLIEWRVKQPILDLRMLRSNRLFLSTNLSALLMYTAHFNAFVMLSFYLQLIRLMDPIQAAFVLVVKFSDRIGSRELSVLGLVLITISLLLMSTLSLNSSFLFIETSLIILGAGVALFAAPNTNSNLSSVTADKRSLANGMLGTMRHLGQGLSLALGAAIIGVFLSENIYDVGGTISALEYVQGLGRAFLLGSSIHKGVKEDS
jgi:MFS family permease